jgi:hypothetical protein
MTYLDRHPEVAVEGGPRRATARELPRVSGRHPPISGLPEIGFKLRKSAKADLRWLAALAPQDDGRYLAVLI